LLFLVIQNMDIIANSEISYEDYDKLRSKLSEFAKYNNYHVERKDEEMYIGIKFFIIFFKLLI
jgi:hypothetical protein